MKIVKQIIFIIVTILPLNAMAEALFSVKQIQEVARSKGVYSGDMDGKITIDVVVAGFELCRIEQRFCEASNAISAAYYVDQAHNIRYASISDASFLKRISPLLEQNDVFSQLKESRGAYFSALMRGSIYANTIFDEESYYLVYINPTNNVLTIIQVASGVPSRILTRSTDDLNSPDVDVYPKWMESEDGNILFSKEVISTRNYLEKKRSEFLRTLGHTPSKTEIKILLNKISNVLYQASGKFVKCAADIDALAGKEGGILRKYEELSGENLPNRYGDYSQLLPSNGFDLGDSIYIRTYNDLLNPEYMAVVKLNSDDCSISAIAYPLTAP